MPSSLIDHNQQVPQHFLSLITWVINSNLITTLGQVWRLAHRMLRMQVEEGMYELLDYQVSLELLDAKGKVSIHQRRKKVRYLQDNIIAFQDEAWGDGNIFAEYECSPGKAVDRYREGYIYRTLISLRGTRQRGQVEEFLIKRKIENGFVEEVETLQTDITHRTKHLSIILTFPSRRLPKSVKLIERNTTKTMPLGPEHFQPLPEGRLQVMWSTPKPRLFEAYIMRWEW